MNNRVAYELLNVKVKNLLQCTIIHTDMIASTFIQIIGQKNKITPSELAKGVNS